MSSRWTFKLKCVQELLSRYVTEDGAGWIDPFAGLGSPAQVTNDINEVLPAHFHLDGLYFLKTLGYNYKGVIFDPPYSPVQCLRLYKPVSKRSGNKSWGTSGKATYLAECRDEISRIVATGGMAISFGWDTCGMGKKRGFEIVEVLDICHGACHDDTLVTVERKSYNPSPPIPNQCEVTP